MEPFKLKFCLNTLLFKIMVILTLGCNNAQDIPCNELLHENDNPTDDIRNSKVLQIKDPISIQLTFIKAIESYTFNILVANLSGVKLCVENAAEINFELEDGELVETKNQAGNDCGPFPKATLMLGSSIGNHEILELLKSRKIKSISIEVKRNNIVEPIKTTLNGYQASSIKKMFTCLKNN